MPLFCTVWIACHRDALMLFLEFAINKLHANRHHSTTRKDYHLSVGNAEPLQPLKNMRKPDQTNSIPV
jgi:propanediol utilization protein